MKISVLAIALGAGSSCAYAGPTFQWNAVGNQNNSAGTPNIHASYNTNTDQFTWNVSYSNGAAKDTDGFWLVVGPGPNPKGHAYEYAIIYFDASTINSPVVSVYRYNGQNADTSYNTPGDLLASSLIPSSTNIVASASQSHGARTFNLTLDATAINARYAGASHPDWKGIQFGDHIGVWMHTVSGLETDYGSRSRRLRSFKYCSEGWLDLTNSTTTRIPAPAALASLGLGLIAAGRRRR